MKVKIAALIISILLIAYYYLLDHQNQSDLKVASSPLIINQEKNDNQNVDSLSQEKLAEEMIVKIKNEDETVIQKNKTETETETETEEYAFLNTQDLHQAFIKNDLTGEIISENALRNSFYKDGFSNLLENISVLENDNIERYYKLQDALSNLKSSSIYDSQFACSGKICALEMVYSDMSAKEISQLESFDTHYIFNNYSKDDSGNTISRTLFIETEDPSKLRVVKGE